MRGYGRQTALREITHGQRPDTAQFLARRASPSEHAMAGFVGSESSKTHTSLSVPPTATKRSDVLALPELRRRDPRGADVRVGSADPGIVATNTLAQGPRMG